VGGGWCLMYYHEFDCVWYLMCGDEYIRRIIDDINGLEDNRNIDNPFPKFIYLWAELSPFEKSYVKQHLIPEALLALEI